MKIELDSNDLVSYIDDQCCALNYYVNLTKYLTLLYCCYGVVLAARGQRLTKRTPCRGRLRPHLPENN